MANCIAKRLPCQWKGRFILCRPDGHAFNKPALHRVHFKDRSTFPRLHFFNPSLSAPHIPERHKQAACQVETQPQKIYGVEIPKTNEYH